MATVYYDRWGGYQGENPAPPTEKLAYIVEEEGGGITYICFAPDDANGNRVVKRISVVSDGGATTTTIEHGYGAWADRATLTYYPINEAIPVTVEG